MTVKLYRNRYPYLMGSDLALEPSDVDHLVRLFEKKPELATEILAGRNAPVHDSLQGMPMVIKFYRRGGMIRHIMKDAYYRSGTPRSAAEYTMLQKARTLGVSCPEPLVWAIRGGLFYKAFLVTRTLENTRSLAELCLEHPDLTEDALKKTAVQVAILVQNRIHHVDLHPGNVLVDEKGAVSIIDFDKAHESGLSPEILAETVIRRWKRAVVKYNLPDMAANVFEGALRHGL